MDLSQDSGGTEALASHFSQNMPDNHINEYVVTYLDGSTKIHKNKGNALSKIPLKHSKHNEIKQVFSILDRD